MANRAFDIAVNTLYTWKELCMQLAKKTYSLDLQHCTSETIDILCQLVTDANLNCSTKLSCSLKYMYMFAMM